MQKQDRARLIDAVLFNLAFLTLIWALWLYQRETGTRLNSWGTHPRTVRGLIGIITTPFLHGSFDHIWGNSLSFITLSTFLIFFYREIAFKVLLLLHLISGVLIWSWAGGGNHIGASGVIYGMASFLFFSGIFRQNPRLLRVALAVAFLYGSIVWWVLPIDPSISWEGHLAGALTGIALAFSMRRLGPTRAPYRWEIEEDENEEDDSNAIPPDDGHAGDRGYFQSNTSDGEPFHWR